MSPQSSSYQIQVAVRIRPPNLREEKAGELTVVKVKNSTTVKTVDVHGRASTYQVDYVIDDSEKLLAKGSRDVRQQCLFDHTAAPLLGAVVEGYSACLLAYGQSGSGKTYTLLGAGAAETGPGLDVPGVIPRAASELFRLLQCSRATRFEVCFSYLEIFHDHLEDLLAPRQEGGSGYHRKRLMDVHMHPTIGVYVSGLTLKPIESPTEVTALLRYGLQTRALSCTSLSDRSSFTHTIATLHVLQYLESDGKTGDKEVMLNSKLQLVDLAGSERMPGCTEAKGRHTREGVMVNKGLHQLTLCITRLAAKAGHVARGHGIEADKIHVPYRDSKLTLLLREALGGNTRTVMIACIAPTMGCLPDTISTLKLVERARSVGNRPSISRRLCGSPSHLDEVRELSRKMSETKREMQRASSRGGGSSPIHSRRSPNVGNASNFPRLVNLSQDPAVSGSLSYELDPSTASTIGCGSMDSVKLRDDALSVNGNMCELVAGDEAGTMNLKINNSSENRVLVNGRQVVDDTVVRDGDRLGFGHSVCFRLVMSEKVSTKATDALQRRNETHHDLAEERRNEGCRESPEYQEAVQFADELSERIGRTRAQEFLSNFSRALPLVAEANALTCALRPHDRIRFSLEVVVDVLTFGSVVPELVVRVWAPIDNADRWANDPNQTRTAGTEKWDIARQSMKDARVRSAFGLDANMGGSQLEHAIEICERHEMVNEISSVSLAEWSKAPDSSSGGEIRLPVFMQKLRLLRELYDRTTRRSSFAAPDLTTIENNVWSAITCYDVRAAIADLNCELADTTAGSQRRADETERLRKEIADMRAEVARARQLCEKIASHEATIVELTAKASKLERTEHELQMAELELQATKNELDQAKIRLAGTVGENSGVEPSSQEVISNLELRLDLSASERNTAIRFAKELQRELSEVAVALGDDQKRIDRIRDRQEPSLQGGDRVDAVLPSWFRSVRATAQAYEITEDEVDQVFTMLDADDNGSISSSEVAELMRMLGLSEEDATVERFMADVADLGGMTRRDFHALMTRKVSPTRIGASSRKDLEVGSRNVFENTVSLKDQAKRLTLQLF
ncbi:hypothetical protein FOL47_009058 [Perkinsus chesapeaki]|uniref:Kinesin-like protein kif21b n=1 Tax=Perkinsus chesapeaki TaxID=330153 RepID=A0A7J6MSH9_PERCH|nr:hypothetical protein FOL47_009058 [Perkinsus chesapeaki]